MAEEVKQFHQTITELKTAILSSRFSAAKLVNTELLTLYFGIGQLISERTKQEKWGSKVLLQIATALQNELPGLKGFSDANLKKMRTFYEVWSPYFAIVSSVTNELNKESSLPKSEYYNDNQLVIISSTLLSQLKTTDSPIGSSVTNQLQNLFTNVGFTNHYNIISQTESLDERLFYITKAATEMWVTGLLKHHIKADLFKKQGALPNNFQQPIITNDLRAKALQSFKDEYFLDFVNIEDPEEENEKVIENEIVRNIKKFLMSLGADFSFIGNQYRLMVDEDEFFIDLLFYKRKLQSLVAFELKKGKFKPKYLGKMNFHLSVLDNQIKQPHENPSIGIILCKEKNNKIVAYSFRDFSKPMGVATYKTSTELPPKYKGILPDADTLKSLL